jgi:hypothetical protein
MKESIIETFPKVGENKGKEAIYLVPSLDNTGVVLSDL